MPGEGGPFDRAATGGSEDVAAPVVHETGQAGGRLAFTVKADQYVYSAGSEKDSGGIRRGFIPRSDGTEERIRPERRHGGVARLAAGTRRGQDLPLPAAPGSTMPASLAAHARHRRVDFRLGDGTVPGIDFLRQALVDWHLMTAGTGADALLVAAELLANAARHTRGPRRLDLDLNDAFLRIAVTDPAPDPPRPRPHRPDATHGHGLFIVQQLAKDWGWRPHGHGKTVWADLPIPGTPGH
ncbi:ATP-binding protein [Kitasatospora sp. NPDC101447]|uniref:ATP-binding protein n=1 Tax=Kitasatospora sp. NPDC101447 TaxID=3364102 RepID=UPI0037F6B75C